MTEIIADIRLRIGKLIANNVFKHVFIAFVIFASAFLASNKLYEFGQQKSDQWMTRGLKYSSITHDLRITDSLLTCIYREQIFGVVSKDSSRINPTNLALPVVRNCKVKRMYQQLTDVAFSAYNHLLIARQFMLQSFVCISMSSIYYILSFALVAFVTKNGWSNTNPLVLTVVICSTAVATFFYGLTSIFKQELNANKNIELYIECINAEEELRSSLVQSKYVLFYKDWPCDTATVKIAYANKMDSLISYFDKRMRDVNKLELGFDANGVTKLRIDVEELKKPKL